MYDPLVTACPSIVFLNKHGFALTAANDTVRRVSLAHSRPECRAVQKWHSRDLSAFVAYLFIHKKQSPRFVVKAKTCRQYGNRVLDGHSGKTGQPLFYDERQTDAAGREQ